MTPPKNYQCGGNSSLGRDSPYPPLVKCDKQDLHEDLYEKSIKNEGESSAQQKDKPTLMGIILAEPTYVVKPNVENIIPINYEEYDLSSMGYEGKIFREFSLCS